MGKISETVDEITKIIDDYKSSNNHEPVGLLNMSRNLAANLFYLEKERSEVHKKFQGTIHTLVHGAEKMSVNKAENKAHFIHPDMYMLRRTMDAGYEN